MIEPHPTASYLIAAMVQDGIDLDLATKVAHGYADKRKELDDDQLHRWLMAMVHRLGPPIRPNTMLAVLAYPSGHLISHYDELAREAGWKD